MGFLIWSAGLVLSAGVLAAGEQGVMHCFYFTAAKEATEADWQAFYKATDALPGKVSGLQHVWYGKLVRPRAIYFVDDASAKKLRGGEASVKADVTQHLRQYGACMQFASEAALKSYAKDPAHADWEKAYFKVREPETTTFDIVGK